MDEQYLYIDLELDSEEYDLLVGEKVGRVYDPILQAKSVAPLEQAVVVIADEDYEGLSSVSVQAIPSNYVGSAIPRVRVSDLIVNGPTVTAPAGYYAGPLSATVQRANRGSPSLSYDPATGSIRVTITQAEGYVTAGTEELDLDLPAVTMDTPTVEFVSSTGKIKAHASVPSSGYISAVDKESAWTTLSTQAAKTVTPTESEQTAVEQYRWTTGLVKVAAIPSDYVGSAIPRRTSASLSVSGAVVTVPAGYYAARVQGRVNSETLATPTISLDSATGVITATETQLSGYVSGETKTATSQLNVQAGKTVTPTESEQTAVAQYRWTTGAVKVAAIPSDYVGSGVTQLTLATPSVSLDDATGLVTVTETMGSGYLTGATKTNTKQLTVQAAKTVTPMESEQTAVAQYRWTTGAVKVAAIPSDYVGSGVAQVTLASPTVTIANATGLITATEVMGSGYLTGGTTTGTKQLTTRAGATITPTTSEQTAVAAYRWTTGAVKVAAIPSQYIVPSGTLTISEEGTFDVTSYASAYVDMGVIPISKGGTGATTAAAALTNLGAVAKAGDTMTGNLTLQKKLVLTSGTAASYGSTLPSSGTTGEVFFKLA